MKAYKKLISLLMLVVIIGVLISCGTTFKVTFDANNDTPIVEKTVDLGAKATKPTDPTKIGYEFIGWFIEDSEEPFDFETKIVEDLILVGKWAIKELTVSFETKGGTSIADEIVSYGEAVLKPADPDKENSVFMGWYLDDELYDFAEFVIEDITLVARWEDVDVMVYMIIYDFNYDDKILEKEGTPGELLEEIEVEKRAGYLFAGWFLNKSFTRPWNFEEGLMPKETLNLYAKWDTIPVITGIKDVTYYIGDPLPDLMAGVEATDLLDGVLPVTLLEGDLDFNVEGEYEVIYKAENLSALETEKTITVTVIYENRLVIKNEDLPQKVYLQVEEEILGFYLELSYDGEIAENNIAVTVEGWITDVNIEEGLIKIVATGLNEIDAYLLIEVLTVNKDVSLEIETVIVDTVTENNVIIK